MSETPTVNVRYFEKQHLRPAIAVEQQAHLYIDEDFGVPQVRPWAWDHEDFRSAIRQYRNKAKATDDTRAWVAEQLVDGTTPEGLKTSALVVVGSLIYETHDDSYEVVLLSACEDHVRKALLDHVFGKSDRSETRKKVTMVVADGDYKTLKFLMNYGRKFKVTPQRNHNPGGMDTWLCVHEAPVPAEPVAAK